MARKRNFSSDLTEKAAATTIRSSAPRNAVTAIRKHCAAADSFASSYTGNVTVSTEAAADTCDAIPTYST